MATEENGRKTLVQKLAEVMGEVERVAKHGRNDFHKYDYATEADILSAVREHMAKRSLLLVPSVEKIDWRNAEGKSPICTLAVKFTVLDGENPVFHVHDGGTAQPQYDSVSFTVMGEGQDTGDKATYKAMTGATKYALLKLFLIPTGDDPERDAVDKPPLARGKFNRRAAGYTLSPEIAARQASRDATAPGDGQPEDPALMASLVTESQELLPSPDPETEREALLKEIKLWADEAGLSPQDRDTAWKTYMGPNVTRKKADPAALADLLRWVKTRAKK